MTKTERWLNLLAFLLDRRYPVPREEILSQVDDYKDAWLTGDDKQRESVRRKFERDKRELRALGVVIEPLKDKVMADHAGQEVEAYLLRPRDFYLPYLAVRTPKAARVPPHTRTSSTPWRSTPATCRSCAGRPNGHRSAHGLLRRPRAHPRRSTLSFAFASSVDCHCMLLGSSAPPQARGTT